MESPRLMAHSMMLGRKEPTNIVKGCNISLMAKEIRTSDNSYTKQKTTQHNHKQLLKGPPRWKAAAANTCIEEGFFCT